MKRPIIIALVGNSGSGKTSLSLYLQERFGIPALVSYTTRPMREGEVDGIDHHFVEDASSMPENPLAHTVFAGKHYWTSHSQISTPVVTYVIDEAGLVELKEKWSDKYDVLAFYISRPGCNYQHQNTRKFWTILPPCQTFTAWRQQASLKQYLKT